MLKKIKTILKKSMVNKKTFYIVMIVFFAVCVIPLIWIGRYNVMSADDFAYGVEVHARWIATGSLWESIIEASRVVIDRYFSWQGTYSSVFFMALNPLIFNDGLGFVAPIMFIGLYSLSTFYFIRCCFRRLGVEKREDYLWVTIISIVEIIVFVLSIESPVEGFFWYNGATHYMFMHAFMLLFLGTFITLDILIEQDKKAVKVLGLLLYFISAVIVGGGNYISSLQCMELCIVLMMLQILAKRISFWHVSGLLVLGTGFLCSVFAPGNSVRQASSGGMGVVEAILNSFLLAIKDIKDWITPIFIIGMLLLIPILYELTKIAKFKFKYPILVIGLEFCLYASLYAPCLYGVGNVDSGRMRNIIQASFYLYVIVGMFYVLGNMRNNIERVDKIWKQDLKAVLGITCKYKVQYLWLAFVCMGIVLLFTGDKNYYSSVSAVRSIVIGEARDYYNQVMVRQDIIKSEDMDIYLDPISVKPHVLYYSDYVPKNDVNNWINRTAANYFGKNSIQLKE